MTFLWLVDWSKGGSHGGLKWRFCPHLHNEEPEANHADKGKDSVAWQPERYNDVSLNMDCRAGEGCDLNCVWDTSISGFYNKPLHWKMELYLLRTAVHVSWWFNVLVICRLSVSPAQMWQIVFWSTVFVRQQTDTILAFILGSKRKIPPLICQPYFAKTQRSCDKISVI